MIICLFFLVAGASRMAKGFAIGPADAPIKVTLDLIAGALGLPAAILAWPLLIGLGKLPSREQLAEAHSQLLHSQQLFDGFMQHSPSLQFVKDSQLRFLYVNDAYCRVFAVKREDVLGKTNQSWMPPEIAQQLHLSDVRVQQTLEASEEMFRIPTPEGVRTWLVVKFPIWDEQLMLGGIGIDISEQKEAEEREQRTKEIFRLMVDTVKEYAIFMLDPEGNILTWNQGAERLKGYKAEEIIGRHYSAFFPPDAVESGHPQTELELSKQNGQYEEEGWRVKKGGSRFWAHVTMTPIYAKDGSLHGFVKVTRDMTDRRQFEKDLAAERDKALEASAMKSTFVANISHEIRTPLSGILGMNELLLQTDLDEEQREYAETVQASSQSLLTVLNDVLDLSKVEAGKLELDQIPFNVAFATQDATRLMSAAAKNKGLTLIHQIDTSIPDLVIGDPERFRQVLLNLVGNAVKFTQKGEVSVTAQLVYEDKNTATIKFEVSDTGMGIAKEDQKYLFVPFAQIDNSSTRRFGGTGLGLTICKHLVNRMHGKIGFESDRDMGSLFWFIVPFPKTTQEPADTSSRSPGVSVPTETTILVVEDNPILRDLARKQLTNLGIKSITALCGADAIEAVNGTQFDMILMDIQLPHMDGYEASKAIRRIEQPRNRRTPIIAMTATTKSADRERALAAGMDDFIAKPVSLDKLRRLCEKWLTRSAESRSHQQLGGR